MSLDTDGGFSGTVGWTPSIASQWPKGILKFKYIILVQNVFN